MPYSNFNGILKKVRLFATKNSSKLLTISDICETKIKVLRNHDFMVKFQSSKDFFVLPQNSEVVKVFVKSRRSTASNT